MFSARGAQTNGCETRAELAPAESGLEGQISGRSILRGAGVWDTRPTSVSSRPHATDRIFPLRSFFYLSKVVC